MVAPFEPLSLLSRKGDKWFLGNGSGLIYAPSFPEYLDVPGFYDYADYFDIKVEPVFTITILDGDLKPVGLEYQASSLFWTPAYTKQRYVSDRGIEVVEWKTISPNDALTSMVEISVDKEAFVSRKRQLLHFVPWVAFSSTSVLDVKPVSNAGIVIRRRNPSIVQAIGSKTDFSSFTVNLSQGSENKPRWELTPFIDKITGGEFKNEIKREVGTDPYGLLYIGLHYPMKLSPQGKADFSFSSSFALSEDNAVKNLRAEKGALAREKSVDLWGSFFASLPMFRCSDPFIEKYYWYRWYGLHLMTVDAKYGNHRYPCVCEGLRIFRRHISYSAQTHVLETRWMSQPALAQGCILGLFQHQKSNGFLPGIVGLTDVKENTFYHANWGRVVSELNNVHPDMEFLKRVYQPLSNYLNYFVNERDCDNDYLYDIVDEMESGQELNPRYLFADTEADKDQPLQEPLEGVDATVYIYELYKGLRQIAAKLGKKDEEEKFKTGASKCKEAMQTIMWDHRDKMFYDVRPSDHEKSKVKAVTCFYPFMCDVASSEHLPSIKEHLLNKNEFWTPYPVATLSMDNEFFSTDAEWKGKRMMCPWNGRVWPMTNSHIAEALVHTAEKIGDKQLLSVAADFISKYIRMMFFDGDINRPNCFEHYNPMTGAPCEYRGINDYQHSWIVDLIIKYVCGIRPVYADERQLTINPLPFILESFSVNNIKYQGHDVKVTWRARKIDDVEQGLIVYVDGRKAASASRLEKLTVPL
nr:trehalase family glycosidase [Candidatus Njordarchaeota archaeon]